MIIVLGSLDGNCDFSQQQIIQREKRQKDREETQTQYIFESVFELNNNNKDSSSKKNPQVLENEKTLFY